MARFEDGIVNTPDKVFDIGIEFARGRGGRVSGFTASVGRAAEIAFSKAVR